MTTHLEFLNREEKSDLFVAHCVAEFIGAGSPAMRRELVGSRIKSANSAPSGWRSWVLELFWRAAGRMVPPDVDGRIRPHIARLSERISNALVRSSDHGIRVGPVREHVHRLFAQAHTGPPTNHQVTRQRLVDPHGGSLLLFQVGGSSAKNEEQPSAAR
jgi:hypothetical protein